MTTVYMVTQGEYSDYHIVGIYSTREGAEALAAYYNGPTGKPGGYGDQTYIEEVELDAPIPADHRGWVASGSEPDRCRPNRGPSVEWTTWRHGEPHNTHYRYNHRDKSWYIAVRAETEEKARLLWADIRRAILAGTIVAPPPEGSANG